MLHFIRQLAADDMFSGRKVNRWTVNLLCAALSAILVYAAWRWANGAELPKLPGETIILAALPYAQSMWDNFTRSSEKRTALNTNAPSINPHGGPDAP